MIMKSPFSKTDGTAIPTLQEEEEDELLPSLSLSLSSPCVQSHKRYDRRSQSSLQRRSLHVHNQYHLVGSAGERERRGG